VSRRQPSVRKQGPKRPQETADSKEIKRHPLVAAVRSHRGWGWAALVAYAAAVTFPHEQVQWACSMLALRITHQGVYRISAAIGFVEVVILSTFLVRRLAGQPQRRAVIGLWILTLALILFAWRMFTANNLELVHYPQYFPEGLALAVLTLSPVDSLSWIVLFGGLDEGYQYWVLSRGRPSVFDFNDIYMDLLGGAAGVIFAMAFLRFTRRRWRPGVIVLMSTIAAGVLMWASGLMLLVEDKANPHYWFALGRFQAPTFWVQIITNGPYKYHTLTPVEGIAVILATITLYAILCRKHVTKCDT
jgi:hypothetical protein